jgi:sarcosine oxidase
MSDGEFVVIGGGVVGAASALALARRGAAVHLIERESIATAAGSSKGSARIFAPAAYPDESYLEMGLQALERWREIEADAGAELLVTTGALTAGAFAEAALIALRAVNERAELLTPADTLARFGVETGGRPALHQPDAGVIRADRAHAALLELADRAGASIRRGEAVISVESSARGAEVVTDRGRMNCAAVVVAAGPWSRPLLASAGIELEATVTAQTVVHFDLSNADHPPVAFMDFDEDEPYALWDPERGLKVAFHTPGLDAGDVSAPPQADPAVAAELERWANRTYPGLVDKSTGVEGCFYTWTPREEFVIQRHGPVVVASACNGQGFQFAPETGERVARMAVGELEESVA